jgi:hypothetical protein
MNHYGKPLSVTAKNGELRISIGIHVLAHAVSYSEWANPFNEAADDYIREFAISDAQEFAKDVALAMQAEREDGSTPLSDFIDKMSEAAVNDGSLGTEEARIKHGETAPSETWARAEARPQEKP